MIRAANIKKGEKYDLYAGRANGWLGLPLSKWHNPFVMKNESDRDRVLNEYEIYVINTPELWDSLEELDGLTLGCFCHPKRCHVDVLNKLLNEKRIDEIFKHI